MTPSLKRERHLGGVPFTVREKWGCLHEREFGHTLGHFLSVAFAVIESNPREFGEHLLRSCHPHNKIVDAEHDASAPRTFGDFFEPFRAEKIDRIDDWTLSDCSKELIQIMVGQARMSATFTFCHSPHSSLKERRTTKRTTKNNTQI